MPLAIVVGETSDGDHRYWGPFLNEDAADNWAKCMNDEMPNEYAFEAVELRDPDILKGLKL